MRLRAWQSCDKHERLKPDLGFENFTQPWVKKIAIAHSGHAPYGEKAKQAMEFIDASLHEPLLQAYAITKHGKDSKLAKDFYDFMQTEDSIKVMAKYGFILPNK